MIPWNVDWLTLSGVGAPKTHPVPDKAGENGVLTTGQMQLQMSCIKVRDRPSFRDGCEITEFATGFPAEAGLKRWRLAH